MDTAKTLHQMLGVAITDASKVALTLQAQQLLAPPPALQQAPPLGQLHLEMGLPDLQPVPPQAAEEEALP